MSDEKLVPVERIEKSILVIRGHKVMLDADLATLYGTTTKRLNEQIRRNRKRFPEDFVFQLTADEVEILRSQSATSRIGGHGGRRYLPYVLTEHGAVMAATILNTPVAIEVSVQVVRAFNRLRALHRNALDRLDQLELKYRDHDVKLRAVFVALRKLIAPPVKPARRIGFKPPSKK